MFDFQPCVSVTNLQYLEDLRDALQNGRDVLAPRARPVMITNFSSGYNGNGLAGRFMNYANSERPPRPVKRVKEAVEAKPKKVRQKKAKVGDLA